MCVGNTHKSFVFLPVYIPEQHRHLGILSFLFCGQVKSFRGTPFSVYAQRVKRLPFSPIILLVKDLLPHNETHGRTAVALDVNTA